MSRSRLILVVLAALAIPLAACGDGDDDTDSAGPVAGESVELETADGEVLTKEPDAESFTVLERATVVPVGTEVDASKGIVRMTSATPDGQTQEGEFSQGGFEITQETGSSEVTLALRGGDFSMCETEAAREEGSTVGGPEVRRVFVDTEGGFRARGRFASATVRGTKFTAVDACFGTLTDVAEGEVEVTDLTADKEIDLGAGERYWAAERADY